MRYLLLIVVLGGCVATQAVWRNPAGTEGFKIDWYECERDARVVTQPRWGSAAVEVDEDFRQQCMEAKGWTRSVEPVKSQGIKQVAIGRP